ncbi:tRNA pseudouridine(38-40) synthase TruA [Alkaliphilus transvaalensis]|uniref:tRNA pseudouridine(38-40) synthase TruA n=1 Tax=Alkaliphilus transvaalensis TaxID=114628 RepID=UPI00047BECB3|nr:tRNA pseudouridine(38-40) synthase TruA [Alkaliphilus transvaalensis]
MRNIMIKIEYDGTNFNGWQIQPNGRTVQEEIMKVLAKLTGNRVEVNGSGRTDAKVHARGQVANFRIESNIPTQRISLAMNSLLPFDISIKEAHEMPEDFHARYSAIGKRYAYQIYRGRHRSPLVRNYAYHLNYDLDMDIIRWGTNRLIGTHDFKGFMASGSSVENTVRSIYSIDINEVNDSLWFTFEGNGFLYNMVRILVGTLVDLGASKKQKDDLLKALETGDRKYAGHTAPPQGLYLDNVIYPLTH